MIDVYTSNTSNGKRVEIVAEETGLAHRVIRLDLKAGDQRQPSFLAISPLGRIPVIVDHAPMGGGEALVLSQSSAIIVYLAEKAGKLLPSSPRDRAQVLEWCMFTGTDLGPTFSAGFLLPADPAMDAARAAIKQRMEPLLAAMDSHLAGRTWLVGDTFTLADASVAANVWRIQHVGEDLGRFANLMAWYGRVVARPAVQRALNPTS